jgi:nicotinate-nucleotide adenylyltransferase
VTERVGVLGGTFDPIHTGHVVAAVEARDACALDRVLVIPAGDPWQKHAVVVAGPEDRLAMVEAATSDVEGLEASRIEIDRDGSSVTADTLEELAAPDRELFLILGADAARNMSTWRRLDDTKALATVVVVERQGERAEPPGEGWRACHVTIPRLDIASHDLRERLAAKRPVDGQVPPSVLRVIRQRALYTAQR